MKNAFSLLRDPRLAVALPIVALCVLLFLYGGRFGLTTVMKLFIVIGLLVIQMGVILWVGRSRKKEAADIEQSLMLDADSMVMTSTGAQREANERAREELATAIESLKKSKIAGGRSGKAALSVLPWYLVFGRDGSGKSTMIRNSGLPLPGSAPGVGNQARGVGPGQSVRWWFTSHAVLLEANGRFVRKEDEVEPRGDWQGVLEVLRKSRPGVPINGLVVTVSIEDVIRHDSLRLDEQARVIRARLDAVREHLETNCPVYLVVTKSDLVHGFDGFFHDLEGNARDQVFGATFSREQIESGDAMSAFTGEFNRLYRSLCKRRIPRMMSEAAAGRRGDLYLFPLEFQSLRAKLLRFVDKLVESNPYGDSPMLRGFYFTSGNCEGEPVEMVVNEVSRVIGLPPDLDGADVTRFISGIPGQTGTPTGTPPPPARPKEDPRFLRELFTRVLLRDAALAQPTRRARRTQRTRRLALRIAALAGVGVLAVLMVVSFARNRGLVAGTVDLAHDASLIPAGGSTGGDIESSLLRLDLLRERLVELDGKDRFRPLTYGFGLYKGKSVNAAARRVYFSHLASAFLGPTRATLQNRLNADYYPTPEEFGDWYRDYRAYRMLIEPENAEPAFLAERLGRHWTDSTPGATERLFEQIRLHVEYAWSHPDEVILHSSELPGRDRALLRRAGELIRENWQPEAFYDAMIEEVNEVVPAYSVASISGAGRVLGVDPDSIDVDPTMGYVPGAYTLAGWTGEVSTRIANNEEQLDADWILKEAFQGQEHGDTKAWLTRTYARKYVAHWNRFLAAVDVPPLPGVAQAAERMRPLAGSASPFVQLLSDAAANLRRPNGEGEDSPLASLEAKFAALHSLFREKKEGDEKFRPLDRFLTLERGVYESLRQLHESPDPSLAAADYAKAILGGVAPPESPIPAAVRFAQRHTGDLLTGDAQCTAAVLRLLQRPAEGAWGSILAECQNYLDVLWDTDVYSQFRPLAGKYPFAAGTSSAPLEEFARFFSPQGLVSTFLETELKPFLERDATPKVSYGYGLALSDPTIDSIRRARAFRRAMFDATGALGFSFWVKPSQTSRESISGPPSPVSRTSRLTIGNTRVLYDMGRRRETQITWPGEAGGGASIAVGTDQPDRDPPTIRQEGDWALFAALDLAEVTARSDTEYDVRWRLERRDADDSAFAITVPYVFRATSPTNPFTPGFFDFVCPRRLGSAPGSVGPGQ